MYRWIPRLQESSSERLPREYLTVLEKLWAVALRRSIYTYRHGYRDRSLDLFQGNNGFITLLLSLISVVFEDCMTTLEIYSCSVQ